MTWYVAITNPNCYRRAENGLAERGYRSFWPKYRKWASHARVKVAKEYPVLGRYLFVEIPDENFYAVRGVDGVEALLTGHDGAPAEVPERKVWEFRERYMRGEWDFVAQSTIPIGARIRIMEGEFANELGIVRSRAKGRLVVLPQGERRLVQTWAENVRAA